MASPSTDSLRRVVEDHGFSCDRHSDWEHAIPGICLQHVDCPEGRTVVEVERSEDSDRRFVIRMNLEDLLPLLGLAVAAGYGSEPDDE